MGNIYRLAMQLSSLFCYGHKASQEKHSVNESKHSLSISQYNILLKWAVCGLNYQAQLFF